MAMSNLYSKIATKPVKRFQDNNIAVSQTNAWVNAESPTVSGSPPSVSPISSSIVLQREGVINQPLSTPASPLSTVSPIAQTFNFLTLEDCTQDPNWQATKPTIRERNAAMFNNPLMADVQFIVGSPGHTQTIPAHKYVLATGSSVFYAMFYGGLAENKKEIEVPDVEPAAFLALLRYMYCDDVKLEADTVLATLYVAKKYIVPHLARACVTFLETSLNAKNACLLLSQSRLFEEPDLMQRCWEVIDAQVSPTLKSSISEANGRNNPRHDDDDVDAYVESQCILYRAPSCWNSEEEEEDDDEEEEEDSLSSCENNQTLQRWQGRQQIDNDELLRRQGSSSGCAFDERLQQQAGSCNKQLMFASYPLSLSESNCFLFDVKLNNDTRAREQFALSRARSEPYCLDSRLDVEVIQNITYKDSFTEDCKDSENNYDLRACSSSYCDNCEEPGLTTTSSINNRNENR